MTDPKGLTADDLAILNEEIAAMAKAGLPLDQGLATLAHEMGRGRLQAVTARLADDLKSGKTLPEAMAAQGDKLPPFYSALVSAGVRSGRLGEVLATLTTYARTMADLRATIINALIYPVLILIVAVALVVFWVIFIGPRFQSIYHDFRLRLPMLTEMAYAVVRHPWLWIGLPLLVIVGGPIAARIILGATESGRITWTRFVYSIPVLGTLIRSARLAAFADLLGILVDHQVPLPEAFQLAGDASSDPLLRVGARRVQDDLMRGQPLGESLQRQNLVSPFLAWMAGLGERNQRLAETLRHSANLYRTQADLRASLFRSLFPGFLILTAAIIVMALFLVVTFLPLLRLMEGLSGGHM